MILQTDEDTASLEQKKILRTSEWVLRMPEVQKDCLRVSQLTQANIHDGYFDNYHNEEIIELPLIS